MQYIILIFFVIIIVLLLRVVYLWIWLHNILKTLYIIEKKVHEMEKDYHSELIANYKKMREGEEVVGSGKYEPYFPVKNVQLTNQQIKMCRNFELIERDFAKLIIRYRVPEKKKNDKIN